jgi:hypothetical protein
MFARGPEIFQVKPSVSPEVAGSSFNPCVEKRSMTDMP